MTRLALALTVAFALGGVRAAADTLADFKRVLAKQPHDLIAFAEVVTAHRKTESYDQLVAEYRRTLAATPTDWAALVVLGRLEQNAGRTAGAIAQWSAAVALRDDDAATWSLLGGVHRFGGDISKARAAYDKAVTHTIDVPTKLKMLRVAIDLAGAANDDVALDRYHDLYRALGPTDAAVWSKRGDALMDKRRHADAHDAYATAEAALGADPQQRAQVILRRAQALEALGRDRDAADACWHGLTTTEGWFVTRDLAVHLVTLHRRMRTLPVLLAQLEKHWPDGKRRHFEWDTLGMLHAELGATSEAIEALSRAAAISPGVAATQHRLIDLLEAAGRTGEALRQIEIAAVSVYEPRFHLDLANRFWRAGDHARAVETIRSSEHRFGRERVLLEEAWSMYVAWGESARAAALRARIDALP